MKALIALVIAISIVGFYVAIFYLIINVLWPILPEWVHGMALIGIGVFLVGSPIFCFLPWAKRRREIINKELKEKEE